MEQYHASVRFILTCNYPNMISPALHSRCQGFHIEQLDQNDFTYAFKEDSQITVKIAKYF